MLIFGVPPSPNVQPSSSQFQGHVQPGTNCPFCLETLKPPTLPVLVLFLTWSLFVWFEVTSCLHFSLRETGPLPSCCWNYSCFITFISPPWGVLRSVQTVMHACIKEDSNTYLDFGISIHKCVMLVLSLRAAESQLKRGDISGINQDIYGPKAGFCTHAQTPPSSPFPRLSECADFDTNP